MLRMLQVSTTAGMLVTSSSLYCRYSLAVCLKQRSPSSRIVVVNSSQHGTKTDLVVFGLCWSVRGSLAAMEKVRLNFMSL